MFFLIFFLHQNIQRPGNEIFLDFNRFPRLFRFCADQIAARLHRGTDCGDHTDPVSQPYRFLRHWFINLQQRTGYRLFHKIRTFTDGRALI